MFQEANHISKETSVNLQILKKALDFQSAKKSTKIYPVCSGCETCVKKDTCHRIQGTARFIEIYVKWGGTGLFFIGSLLFATTHWAGDTPITFMLFAIGHSLWALAGGLMRDNSVVSLNCMYIIFDLAAMWIRM